MAEMLGLPRYCVPYDDFDKKGVVPEGWDERGIPWVVEIPWLGTYFTNGFFYGLVSLHYFDSRVEVERLIRTSPPFPFLSSLSP